MHSIMTPEACSGFSVGSGSQGPGYIYMHSNKGHGSRFMMLRILKGVFAFIVPWPAHAGSGYKVDDVLNYKVQGI